MKDKKSKDIDDEKLVDSLDEVLEAAPQAPKGLQVGDICKWNESMVYLGACKSADFCLLPWRTRFAYEVVCDASNLPIQDVLGDGRKTVFVQVAVSLDEWNAPKKRFSKVEDIPFAISQVKPEIFARFGEDFWLAKANSDKLGRSYQHGHETTTSLLHVLRAVGFSSLEEVRAEVAKKSVTPILSKSDELLAREKIRRKRISEAIRRGWALRKARLKTPNGATPTNSDAVTTPRPGEEGLTRRQIGQRRRWEKVRERDKIEEALLLNRAPQQNESSTGRVLILDIQSERTGYIDVRNAGISGLELSIKFPGTFRLVERVYGGVLWLCLESNDKVGLPSVEFWALTRKASHGVKVVIT